MVKLPEWITGRRLVPALVVIVVALLGFFAFHTGFGSSPTGLVALGNATLSGSFNINNNALSLPVEHSILRFSAPESARIITKNGEINGSGAFWADDFIGTIEWNGEIMRLEGTMGSINGQQLSIVFTRRDKATIIMTAGSIDASTVNISSFSSSLTGNMQLEGRWTIKLNETPVILKGFEGSAVFQRVGNDTTLYFSGRVRNVKLEQENILKNMA